MINKLSSGLKEKCSLPQWPRHCAQISAKKQKTSEKHHQVFFCKDLNHKRDDNVTDVREFKTICAQRKPQTAQAIRSTCTE